MAEHIWSVLCESTTVDKYTNQVSLFSIVESLNYIFNGDEEPPPDGKTSIAVQMRLVSYWARSKAGKPERCELRMSLEVPGRRTILGQSIVPIDLETAPRARTISMIATIRYSGPGEYAMLLDYRCSSSGRWVRAARLPFEVAVHSAASLGPALSDSTSIPPS